MGREGDTALVELTGDIEYGAFGPWSEELSRLVDEGLAGGDGVTLDVAGLTFIDLEGVAMLLRLAQRTRSAGNRFAVRGADGQVARKLAETGVLAYLTA